MATKLFPDRSIFVPASKPHPPLAEYKCSFGREEWEEPAIVKKVQMVYANKIAGRVSPSFPVNRYDEQAVNYAMSLLSKGYGYNSPTKKLVVTVAKTSKTQNLDTQITEQEDLIHDFNLELCPPLSIVETKHEHTVDIGNNLRAFVFTVKFNLKTES